VILSEDLAMIASGEPYSRAEERRPVPWVLVSAGFHERGGQSKANAALADHLLARGTSVHLVGHDFDARFRGRSGCTVHAVARPLRSDFLGVFGLRRRGREVARQVSRESPGARVVVNGGCCQWGDINWVHYVHSAWRAAPAALRSRVKEAVAGALFRRQERQALAAAGLVLANSEQTRRVLLDRVGLDPRKVRTLYLGGESAWRPATEAERAAARARLGQGEGRPLVLFLGGLGHDERKGFDTLWRAWAALCADPAWDADLLVAGGGAAAGRWAARVATAGLTRRVRLLGFTDRVSDLLAAADLLVSPVRYEPYGLNVQEAVCRGVPALVSGRAGVVEQFPPDLAGMVLLDPEDAADLAARLRRWRADADGWRRRFAPLGAALRARGWERMAEELVALADARLPRRDADVEGP
jgi:glycosyltransferase involved in cell wall biosynthesis